MAGELSAEEQGAERVRGGKLLPDPKWKLENQAIVHSAGFGDQVRILPPTGNQGW